MFFLSFSLKVDLLKKIPYLKFKIFNLVLIIIISCNTFFNRFKYYIYFLKT